MHLCRGSRRPMGIFRLRANCSWMVAFLTTQLDSPQTYDQRDLPPGVIRPFKTSHDARAAASAPRPPAPPLPAVLRPARAAESRAPGMARRCRRIQPANSAAADAGRAQRGLAPAEPRVADISASLVDAEAAHRRSPGAVGRRGRAHGKAPREAGREVGSGRTG